MPGSGSDWLDEALSAYGEACKARLDGTGEPEAAIRPPIETLLQQTASTFSLSLGPESVLHYDVGGMPVVKKWFDYRKANPGGRVSSPLDSFHVSERPYEWTIELNDLLTALRRLVELEPRQRDLLDRIVDSAQLTVAELTTKGILPVSKQARKPRRAVDLEIPMQRDHTR